MDKPRIYRTDDDVLLVCNTGSDELHIRLLGSGEKEYADVRDVSR